MTPPRHPKVDEAMARPPATRGEYEAPEDRVARRFEQLPIWVRLALQELSPAEIKNLRRIVAVAHMDDVEELVREDRLETILWMADVCKSALVLAKFFKWFFIVLIGSFVGAFIAWKQFVDAVMAMKHWLFR